MKLKSSSFFSQPAKRVQLSPEKFRHRSLTSNIFLEDSGIPMKHQHKQEDFGVFSPEVSGFPDPSELREGVKILKPNQIHSTRIGGSQFLVGNQ
ncbi:hypothetical protein L5515_010368 [Caenorhabditis briggsae]|uniref:Uncharacterized protein n=1 Tax=Caenorhabditis briggsae TaxID=6238 RepID=A0AAE9JD38_CAEBR|nr:hypothetical protein L5515_010368 [Caenorhabditis briggsae]